jgi:transposase
MTTPSQKPKRPDRYAKHSGNQPNDARRFAVKSMYEAGLSVRAIAERIGVTFQSVHSMLQRMGIKMRPRGASTGSHSRHRK